MKISESLQGRCFRYYKRTLAVWRDEGPLKVIQKGLRVLLKEDYFLLWRVDRYVQGLGYQVVRTIKPGLVFKLRRNGEYFVLKRLSETEFHNYAEITRLLSDHKFKRLVIPGYIEGVRQSEIGSWVITSWVGEAHNRNLWPALSSNGNDTSSGDLKSLEIALDLIGDLLAISEHALRDSRIGKSSGADLSARAKQMLDDLRAKVPLPDYHYAQAKKILRSPADPVDGGRLQLSNGDLHFGNIIEISPTQSALVDWSYTRISPFEQEMCLAYLWVRLSFRPDCQRVLLSSAQQRFEVHKDWFRVALLYHTLYLAVVVGEIHPQVRPGHVKLFCSILDDQYYESIWRCSESKFS